MFVLLMLTGPPAYQAYEPQAGPPAYGPSAGPPEGAPGVSQAGPPVDSQAGPPAGPDSRSAPKPKPLKCDCGVDLSKSAEVGQKRSALELQAEWEKEALQIYHEKNGQNQQQPHQQEQQQNAKRRHKREATKSKKTSKDKSKGEDRIVNGYEAETQPWLASIANCYVKDGEEMKIIGQRGVVRGDECHTWHIHCGGSLINRRYAL